MRGRHRPTPKLSLRAGIEIRFRPELTAHRGKLFSRKRKGEAVHAGTELRHRRVVMDRDLLSDSKELTRIFIHELLHFAWVRLGNPLRRSFEQMLTAEWTSGSKGELGWSAHILRQRLSAEDVAHRTRRWRDYCCESFCDTGAWRYGDARSHQEFTLAERYRRRRAHWFDESLEPRLLVL